MKQPEMTPEEQKVFDELYDYTKVSMVIAAIVSEVIDDLLQRHKEAHIKIPLYEKQAWTTISNSCKILKGELSGNTEAYRAFNSAVSTCKFLLIELIAKCDDSDMRLWQFHNLLKTYPTVIKGLQKPLDEETKAFARLFNQNV